MPSLHKYIFPNPVTNFDTFVTMNLIKKYFPHFSDHQLMQFTLAAHTYADWNEKINVISRKDIDNITVHHFLHSLGIARFVQFADGTHVIDIGTGGGFPGIPLAIAFPRTRFLLVDSIGKKLQVVQAVADAIGLRNVHTQHERAEKVTGKFDFVTGRAVETIPEFYGHVQHLLKPGSNSTLANGILYLKGGDFSEELKGFKKEVREFPLREVFEDEFFETKKLVYVPV